MITKKEEKRLTVNDDIKKLFQEIYAQQNKPNKETDEPKIRVSDIISKMAFYYEKIRNSVDDKEEHLLHKNAIDRIIRRQVSIEQSRNGNEIASHLLTEMIRGGYLPNNKLPETKIGEVGAIINKYIALKKLSAPSLEPLPYEERKEINRWFIGLAACEIEEKLKGDPITKLAINILYTTLEKNILFPDDSPYIKDKDIQIFSGIYKSYLKADRDMTSYVLFKYYVADWQNPDQASLEKLARNIVGLHKAISYQLDHPLSPQLARVIDRYAVYFSILSEVISDNPVAVYDDFKKDPKAFPRNIKSICGKRYKKTRSKLWRAAFRSIIYLFCTKMVLVFILEVPVSKLLSEPVSYSALAINVSMPPLLLFLIVLFTGLPGEANTAKIVNGVEELTFVEKSRQEPIRLRQPIKRSGFRNSFFNVLYGITFFISFGGVVYLLHQIKFNFVSITIFLFFLALISFFSIRIRKRVRELMVVDAKENIFGFFTDFFYIPIIAVGKWLSVRFSKINVFVFVLDFIIEAPFKVFVEIAEEWSKYVKERKEDISQ
ncbi:hypothetical protein HGA64_01480 [Candidatus Falkowbacteria bacterium]|nr:hypothetical protein [Candidatus Falkowbacteria bacterium]